jgi:hypothetical protein
MMRLEADLAQKSIKEKIAHLDVKLPSKSLKSKILGMALNEC